MMTAIMTDTNSGISIVEGKKMGIYVLPMPVLVDGNTYFEGEDFNGESLFRYQGSNSSCSTSQPSPGSLMQMWDEILNENWEQIIYIPMSSGLSSSCHTAMSLAEEYDGKVIVVDNHRISVTQRQSVWNAVQMVEKGMDALTIKTELENDALQSSIYVAVDSIEQLKKGGRVTPGAAVVATALNIKPILTIQGETLDMFQKCRGMRKAMKIMLDAVQSDLKSRFSEWNQEDISIGVASTFLDNDNKEFWLSLARDKFPDMDIFYDDLPCSIGSHVGKDAVGIGISNKCRLHTII